MPAGGASHSALEPLALEEAAAFVAVLSRVLSSPKGASYRDRVIEVWYARHEAAIDLYLSAAALEAAQVAFDPVAVRGACHPKTFTAHARLLFDHSSVPAWGADDARRALRDS
jgi:hypothetical protein